MQTPNSYEASAGGEHDSQNIRARFWTVSRILNVMFRAIAWFVVTYFLFLVLVPEFGKVLAEFEIELPKLTVLIFQISDLLCMFWFLGVPFFLSIYLGAEVAISIATGRVRRWILRFFWAVVLMLLVGVLIPMVAPLAEVVSGLAN